MKRIISVLLLLVMILGLVSCFNTNDPTTTTTTQKKEENPDISGFDPDELALFDEFFSLENHVSLKLDISDSELKKIQQDYEYYSSFGSKSPIYRMADLYITITKPSGEKLEFCIDQVGVRMKGNTSRTSFYSDDKGMYNLVHFKISFGETFDDEDYYGSDALVWQDKDARKARKNRTFATLEKIDIRWNRNDDPTYIREIYAYEYYREQGVLAPHTNLASVDIGNDHAGVWLVYEPIDKIFLEKNLSPEALGGDLYKLGWTNEPADFTSVKSFGVEDEDEGKFYIYDLKTNKKTSDHSSLKNLINIIKSSSLTKEKFENVVDIDNFLAYSAASYMIGNPDDLRNNYNNSYIYFRADTGKMIIIPYDMDRGLGVNTWNPYGDGMTTDSPFQTYNVCGEQRSPLFKKTIQESGFLVDEFTEALLNAASSEMLTNVKFAEQFNIAKNLYADDTTPSRQYENAYGYDFHFDIHQSCSPNSSSNMSFNDYITLKKNTLSQYISGYTPDIDDSYNNGMLDFEVREYDYDMELYLRGDFGDNDWSNQEQYKFEHNGEGLYYVVVTSSYVFEFKVYNNKTGDWYNFVDEDKTTAWFENVGYHQNIQVEAGTYIIYFDSAAKSIYFENK